MIRVSPEAKRSSSVDSVARNRRVIPVLTLLTFLLPATFIAQETPSTMPTEPEIDWIFPLGDRRGGHWQAEVEGRLLDEVHGVWFPSQGLKGRILEVRELPIEMEKGEEAEAGTQEKLRTQRV